jgi:transposase, IS5 family
MARREQGQLSLADGLVDGRVGSNRQLERIAELVDWERFEALLSPIYASRMGRPSYGPVSLFKCLLLQQWYRLSDPGLEEALSDRLSFRRFVGLRLGDPTPDHSTLSRFRSALRERGLADALLAELNRQLDGRGLIVREGTLIDATLVAADAREPRGDDAERASDKDARLVGRRKKPPHYGYKAHVAVDEGSGIIRAAVLTPANTHDLTPAERLVQGDEGTVYADKAYDSRAFRGYLQAAGIGDGVMRRDGPYRKLDGVDHQRNQRLAKRRAAVERVFGLMKRSYGYARVRYRSLARNAVQLALLAVAINLRRAAAMTR